MSRESWDDWVCRPGPDPGYLQRRRVTRPDGTQTDGECRTVRVTDIKVCVLTLNPHFCLSWLLTPPFDIGNPSMRDYLFLCCGLSRTPFLCVLPWVNDCMPGDKI